MSDTTEIEKKSLEAHVELCAERYRFLEQKMEHFEKEIKSVKGMIEELSDMTRRVVEKRNDQLISWGLGIMGVMIGIIAWLASKVF